MVDTLGPGFAHITSPAIYRGPMAACYPLIRPIAQGKSGHVYLAAFYRKECPLVPLSMLHTSRAKPVVNIWPLTIFGGGGTVGHRLQQRFLCNFMQQQCLFWVFFSFLGMCGSTSIPMSVTVIFLMQATAVRIF